MIPQEAAVRDKLGKGEVFKDNLFAVQEQSIPVFRKSLDILGGWSA